MDYPWSLQNDYHTKESTDMTTYLQYEQSIDSAEPIELYLFTLGKLGGEGTKYAFTSSGQTVVHNGDTYVPDVIKREASQINGEMAKNVLNITVQKNNPVPQWFIPGAPFDIVECTIFRQHTAAQTSGNLADNTFIVIFKGRVTSCNFDNFEATLTIEPIATILKRAGLRRTYEPSCTHSLYSTRCGVNKASHGISFTATFPDKRKRVVISHTQNGLPAVGYYTGGILEVSGTSHMIAEHRLPTNQEVTDYSINAQDHVLILIRHIQAGVAWTGSVRAYPGCDLTQGTCKDKFQNIANYGGFPFMPATNPFTSDTVQW